jgi:hypothetical protein
MSSFERAKFRNSFFPWGEGLMVYLSGPNNPDTKYVAEVSE